MKKLDIVLASSSPRRREILEMLGVDFRIVVSDADENVENFSSPADFVLQTSAKKGEAVLEMLRERGELHDNTLVIAADTVVIFRDLIIGKPLDEAHAILTLGMLSDSWHSVLTGLSVYYKGKVATRVARTDVKFRDLSEKEIMAYVESGEPMGKAGSYAIQMKGSSLVERVEGEYYNVVGLPVTGLISLMREEFSLSALDWMKY